jgi:hypothetical protein
LKAAGEQRPAKKSIELFGAKLKTIPDIDPYIMADTIARMVERNKGPTLLPAVYGDCRHLAEDELARVRNGGGTRVR